MKKEYKTGQKRIVLDFFREHCDRHFSVAEVTDAVCYQGKLFALSSPMAKVEKSTAHGTGCTLSAALAANFASGKSFPEALMAAKAFVYGSLCENVKLSGTLAQMYPPEKDYIDQVRLERL